MATNVPRGVAAVLLAAFGLRHLPFLVALGIGRVIRKAMMKPRKPPKPKRAKKPTGGGRRRSTKGRFS